MIDYNLTLCWVVKKRGITKKNKKKEVNPSTVLTFFFFFVAIEVTASWLVDIHCIFANISCVSLSCLYICIFFFIYSFSLLLSWDYIYTRGGGLLPPIILQEIHALPLCRCLSPNPVIDKFFCAIFYIFLYA